MASSSVKVLSTCAAVEEGWLGGQEHRGATGWLTEVSAQGRPAPLQA